MSDALEISPISRLRIFRFDTFIEIYRVISTQYLARAFGAWGRRVGGEVLTRTAGISITSSLDLIRAQLSSV